VAAVPTRRAQPTSTLPPLPGIDSARALAHFDHSPALMQRALRAFADSYGGGLASWQTWIDAGRWSELNRAAHTLQGLAGTVGAQPLRELALQLELQAKAQDGAARSTLALLQPALGDLVAVIDSALQHTPAEPEPTAAGDLTLSPREALAGLRELLEQSDSQVIDWWNAHRRTLREALSAPALRSVGIAINGYDFDAALAALTDSQADSQAEPAT
jgi:HPt (histidine-containing phosphotransfer) domain-containing protein